jgi:hypothetical protein
LIGVPTRVPRHRRRWLQIEREGEVLHGRSKLRQVVKADTTLAPNDTMTASARLRKQSYGVSQQIASGLCASDESIEFSHVSSSLDRFGVVANRVACEANSGIDIRTIDPMQWTGWIQFDA